MTYVIQDGKGVNYGCVVLRAPLLLSGSKSQVQERPSLSLFRVPFLYGLECGRTVTGMNVVSFGVGVSRLSNGARDPC